MRYSPAAAKLLFTDRHGQHLAFEDVVAEGLEPGYEGRIPGLLDLMERGSPYERLYATSMLAAWGHPRALATIVGWAGHPESVPWSDEPVVFDRQYGADQSFDMLADALGTSFARDDHAIADLRDQALDALLRIYHRYYFGSWLPLALLRDRARLPRHAAALREAIEASLGRLERGEAPGFDLALQTASALEPLGELDDDATAAYAERLMRLPGVSPSALRQLAVALGGGSGPATLLALDQLKALDRPGVEPYLTQALRARER